MADSLADGRVRASYVAAIAAQAAPTVAELNLGTQLQSLLTPDGLIGFMSDTAKAPTSSLATVVGTARPGQETYDNLMLRFKKQMSGDTMYTTLGVRGVTGYIVIRYDLAETTAWAAAQVVDVFPIETTTRRRLTPEASSVNKYEISLCLTVAPSLDVAVV